MRQLIARLCQRRQLGQLQALRRCRCVPVGEEATFDVSALDFLICPVSKAPLRWDAAASELVCDEWAIAYPVQHGTALLRPGDGRVMKANTPPAPNGASAPAEPASEPWQT